jgi:hypothetical protein
MSERVVDEYLVECVISTLVIDLVLNAPHILCLAVGVYCTLLPRPTRSRKPRLATVGIRCADHETPSIRKSRHYFANKRR